VRVVTAVCFLPADMTLVMPVVSGIGPLVPANIYAHKMPASSIRFSAARALLPNVRAAIAL
jgi:hypothetical protein